MKNILRRHLVLLGYISVLMLSVSCNPPAETHQAAKPNFLFILVDDLGQRDIGAFGSTFYETPNVDKLAADGAMFTDAYAACPVCSPTRASIMTGKYPATLNITDWIPGRQSYTNTDYDQMLSKPFTLALPLEETTIAEALKENGYQTFFTGKWHIGETEEFWPQHQGFDINKGGWAKGYPRGGYFSPYKNPMLEDGPEGEFLTERLADECISFLDDRNEADPFFMYLSFYTVHNPQQGKPELIEYFKQKAAQMGIDQIDPFVSDRQWMIENQSPGEWKDRFVQSSPVYASMVYSMDQAVGKVMKKLEDAGVADNTVVIFMSDNGGLSTAESSPTSNLPLRGGKGWLYEGGIREPMIIKWPGNVQPGMVINEPVTSTDFYPTMLEMAGVDLMPEQHVDGTSMVPLLTRKDGYARAPLFWHYPHYSNQGDMPGGAIRAGDYKLIKRYIDDSYELYNLRSDIGETRNLIDEEPEKAAELIKVFDEYVNKTNAQMMIPNPDYKGTRKQN